MKLLCGKCEKLTKVHWVNAEIKGVTYRFTTCDTCKKRTYIWATDDGVRRLMGLQNVEYSKDRENIILFKVKELISLVEEA